MQLWDLSAGKQLAEFRDHTAAAIVVKFHPNEFFLASGSMDRWRLLTACCYALISVICMWSDNEILQ